MHIIYINLKTEMKDLDLIQYIKGCKYHFITYLVAALILSLSVFTPAFFHDTALSNLINLWVSTSMILLGIVGLIFNIKKNSFNKITNALKNNGAIETLEQLRFNIGFRNNGWENYILVSGYFRSYTLQIEVEKEGMAHRLTFVAFVDPMRANKKIKGDGIVKSLKFYPDQIHFRSKLRIPSKYNLAENLENTLNDFIDFLEENKVKPH